MEIEMLRSLMMLASVVEAKDPYTAGHLWRVAQYAKLFCRPLNLSDHACIKLMLGAFLHDLGKVGIPDHVLLKKGPLTNQEYEIIRTHPSIGFVLVREHPLGHLVADVVEHHHEWVDGNGYPGLEPNTELSIQSQIVSLVDAFDALTSTRAYRSAKSIAEALDILEERRDSQFRGELIDLLGQFASSGRLDRIHGFSFEGRPLLGCNRCGPVIARCSEHKAMDLVTCPVCGDLYRLRKSGDEYEVEATGCISSAKNLVPKPDIEAIDYHLHEFAHRSSTSILVSVPSEGNNFGMAANQADLSV